MTLSHSLIIYKGKAPNKENATHIFSDSAYNVYTSTAAAMTQIAELSAASYELNRNVVKMQCDADGEGDYSCASYILEITRDLDLQGAASYKNVRAYFVESVYFQSGIAYMNISLDNWGTYAWRATFGRMHVSRFNLYGSDNAFYDDAYGDEFLNALQTDRVSTTYDPSELSIVFILSYNLSQGVFNDDKIARTEMFAATLQDCINACNLSGLVTDSLTAIEMALDIIGGVYGVTSNIGSNEAEVSKAWIVPTSFIKYGDVVLAGVKVKSLFTRQNGNTLTNVRNVVPSFATGSFNLRSFQTFRDYYPNLVVYFGPKYNGFKVPRRLAEYSSKNFYVYYRVTIGQDDIQVVLFKGEEEHDVSSNFAIRLTTANDIANPLQAIARDFSFGFRVADSAVSGFTKGGAAGAVTSAAKSFLGAVRSTGVGKANGSGDGFVTWNIEADRNAAHKVKSPFYFMYYFTLANEKARAVINGARFDTFLSGLTPLKTAASDLHFIADYANETRAFVQIDEMLLEGIPNEAIRYIKEELARGVYYAFAY